MNGRAPGPRRSLSRGLYAAAVAAVVLLGLLSRRIPLGAPLWDEWLGDTLYASAAYLGLAAIRPEASPRALALIALAWCIGVEFFQLTGIPERYSTLLAVRLLLGTTFAAQDLVCYVIGVLSVLSLDSWARSRLPGS